MKAHRVLIMITLMLALSGCAARALMPTPNLYVTNGQSPFQTLAPALQSHQVNLLYLTDRKPERDEAGNLAYGFGRSDALAFGSVLVEIGDDVAWVDLQALSQRRERPRGLPLKLGQVVEQGRFPATPIPFKIVNGAVEENPASVLEWNQVQQQLHEELRRRLALTPRKQVYIFIHGYNNSFTDAAFTQAELWHFLGREGVPVIYSWPAGRGGPTGYAYDRESGEFTVFHLKRFLKSLSALAEIEKMHILAHSRGTDVALTALRELFIEERAAGGNARQRYRIANLVLASPDIDQQVLTQRVIAEHLGRDVKQVTIYVSAEDKALGLAKLLFGSLRRLGGFSAAGVIPELRPDAVEILESVDNIYFVEIEGKTDFIGHGYFHTDPAASSDVILVLRYGFEPGIEHGRPLEPKGLNFWAIRDGYPAGAEK